MKILSFLKGLFSKDKKELVLVTPTVTPEPVVVDQESAIEQVSIPKMKIVKNKDLTTSKSARVSSKKVTLDSKQSIQQKNKTKVNGKTSKKTNGSRVQGSSKSKK